MGCGMFSSEKAAISSQHRSNKRTQLMDGRRKSSLATVNIVENITIENDEISQKEKQFACEVLKKHNLFCMLSLNEIQNIAEQMEKASVLPSQIIFKQGDTASSFFIIDEGEVEIRIGDKRQRILSRGDCFGEIALIYTCARTATTINLTKEQQKPKHLKLLFIRSKIFKQSMKIIREKNQEKTRKIVSKVEIFSLLSNKQKFSIINNLVRECYKEGAVLFEKGDPAYSFYIIESGKVGLKFQDPCKKDITLAEFDSFGESALKKQRIRQGTAIVESESVFLTINEERMTKILGANLSNIIFHNVKKWALLSSPIFSGLQNYQLDRITTELTIRNGKEGQVLFKAHAKPERIIINLEGRMNGKPAGTLFNEQFFQTQNETLENDIIKNDKGVYSEISFKRLKNVMVSLKEKRKNSFKKRRSTIHLMKENQLSIDFSMLDYLTKLGEGQFGMVYLVRERKSGQLFALKCLDKKKIKEQNMESSAISQRDILSSLCHPLIVGFYKAYEDSKNIYFLLQHIEGLEMFEVIRQIGILNKIIARFYFGSLLVGIEHLHSKNIIYRDIKPQNSIVNCQGKVFLIDLGTAKQMKSENLFRTDTIIGTPHYMAPEVMQGKGYSFEVDIWSLGILFYQLICGHLPFAEHLDSPYAVYSEIVKKPVSFPSFVTDESAKEIIRKMLNKTSPEERRGPGDDQFGWFKESIYFEGFKWEDLQEGKMISPYVPKKFRNGKTSKFEEMKMIGLVDFLSNKRRASDKVSRSTHQKSGKLEIKEWLTEIVK